MADIDVVEQFLNFILHHTVQPFSGVNLTAYFLEELEVPVDTLRTRCTLWVRWTRCGMGFKPSPYITSQGMLHAEELIRGDPLNHNNLFRYVCVVLNLPGQKDYNPSKPWDFKFWLQDNNIANDFFVYVDDIRTTG
jgi:hypothetical protein